MPKAALYTYKIHIQSQNHKNAIQKVKLNVCNKRIPDGNFYIYNELSNRQCSICMSNSSIATKHQM